MRETNATQVPHLVHAHPRRILVQLGGKDLLEGFDESHFHAGVVELCDRIGRHCPDAEVDLVAIPELPVEDCGDSGDLSRLRLACNAACEVTATLRGFRFCSDRATGPRRRAGVRRATPRPAVRRRIW